MPKKDESTKVCDKCGHANPLTAERCSACKSTRFAPNWVTHLRRVNRSFAVQITTPSAEYETDITQRLTLYKWWPGGAATFNINTSAQWNEVKRIVDEVLSPFLGWRSKEELTSRISSKIRDGERVSTEFRTLASQDPGFLTDILKAIELDKVAQDDYEQIVQAVTDIASIYLQADESLRHAILRLVKKLPSEGKQAILALADLMESLTLAQITAVTNEVRRRLGLLATFKDRALDDRTYEIQGDNSIHRLLESAMWIVDDRYWLMHSNATLRTVIGKELAKKDKKFEKTRPDFVCGAVDNKLVIVELKRPSHKLSVDDLNQLERYVVIAEEYETIHTTFEAILVGKKVPGELKQVLKLRSQRFSAKSFVDLVGDTERRYKAYLDAIPIYKGIATA
jgi:hypothetical protein